MLPDVDEPALPADRPHAAASSAHAATAAVMAPILLVAPIGSSSGPARHYWMPALSAVSIRLPFKPPHPRLDRVEHQVESVAECLIHVQIERRRGRGQVREPVGRQHP